MAKIVAFVKSVRNNWKKSVFGCMVLSYGVHYFKEKHDCHVMMEGYCCEALKYGNSPYSEGTSIRNVTVFVNPAANNRKAKKDFDKYCAPLLNLAGIRVKVVLTTTQGEARTLAEQLDESVDAVIVAGGDGTLSETVTGLLRRETGPNPLSKKIPVGILPLGQINTAAKYIFGNGKDKVKTLAEACMSVIQEVMQPVDVIRIDQLDKEETDQRSVYSVSGLRWGALHDTYAKRHKYWYWGALKEYIAYIFMGLKGEGNGVTWNCSANLQYSLPCHGCSECYVHEETVKRKTPHRWWQSFVPKQRKSLGVNAEKTDYSQIKNETCSEIHDVQISSVDLTLEPAWKQQNEDNPDAPHIKVSIGPTSISYWNFISRGWQFVKGASIENNTLQVKEVKLQPNVASTKTTECWFYIDNDDYEVKPVYIKLLPKRIIMFYQRQVANPI